MKTSPEIARVFGEAIENEDALYGTYPVSNNTTLNSNTLMMMNTNQMGKNNQNSKNIIKENNNLKNLRNGAVRSKGMESSRLYDDMEMSEEKFVSIELEQVKHERMKLLKSLESFKKNEEVKKGGFNSSSSGDVQQIDVEQIIKVKDKRLFYRIIKLK